MRSREHFTHQLEALHTELYTLGELVVVAITRAVDALTIQDIAAARSIVSDDQHIDRAQYALEEQAVAIIATQQPVASDLRQIIAVIAIASELERIADYAKGMAKLTIRDAERPQVPIPDGLMQMAEQARAMLTRALALRAEWAEAYAGRGLAYYRKGEHASAIADYDHALALQPAAARLYNNRGLIYYQNGEMKQAIADFTQAIDLQSNFAEAYYNRGRAIFDSGDLGTCNHRLYPSARPQAGVERRISRARCRLRCVRRNGARHR
jgi:tetratricopeptide (TPR) repeat protein